MADEIMRSLLKGPGAAPAAERYAKGLFSSYVGRAEEALQYAKVMGARRDARQRTQGGQGLRRATEQVCKAVRVANDQSATRSRDVRALLFGDDAIDPLADANWRERIAPMVRLTELEAWTDHQLVAWTSALGAIVDDLAKTEPQSKRPARIFRFASRPESPSADASDSPDR
jgi:hypothetical protein